MSWYRWTAQHDSGIHQLSKVPALPSVAHASAQIDPLELQSSSLSQRERSALAQSQLQNGNDMDSPSSLFF